MKCYYSEKNQPSKQTMLYIIDHYGFTPLSDDDLEFVLRNGLAMQVKQISEAFMGIAKAVVEMVRGLWWGVKQWVTEYIENHKELPSKRKESKRKWRNVKHDRIYRSQVIENKPKARARSNC